MITTRGMSRHRRPEIEAAVDLGSASVKVAALDAEGRVVAAVRRPIRGRLQSTVDAALKDLENLAPGRTSIVAVTGARAAGVAGLLRGFERLQDGFGGRRGKAQGRHAL